MSRLFKIVLSIFILAGIIFFAVKFFNPGQYSQNVCPPDKCSYNKEAKPTTASFKAEPGRLREDFSAIPPNFPKDIPTDPKPIKVVQSYTETAPGDKGSGEPSHRQTTYIYITSQDALTSAKDFEKYLKENKYDVSVGKIDSKEPTYSFYGHKTSGTFEQSITISIVTENQFERLVTISLVNTEATNQ